MFCLSGQAVAVECNGDTQFEMRQCAGIELATAEQRLDVLFSKLNAKLDASGQQQLENAKQAWLDYRKKQCAFETGSTEGGSIHPMMAAYCYASLTREYIKRLQAQVDCEEGDLSCVR